MGLKILVVDDLEYNVALLEKKLLAEYYEVITASSGVEALECLEKKACNKRTKATTHEPDRRRLFK